MLKYIKLVELQTKVASVFPFILGNLWAIYRFNTWHLKHALVMFISLICIDMATTTLNNYMDYKKAIKKEGFNFESHNAIVKYKIKEKTVLFIILSLIGFGAIAGLYLVYLTNIFLFIMGGLAFLVGIMYSFGPLPISRTPLGEMFSGIVMGFGIVFISTFIHVYDQGLILISLKENIFLLSFNYKEILAVLLVSLPLTLGISNIMLANNICDVEDDLINKRYTLPVYIGKEFGLTLYFALYFFAALTTPIMVILKITPWYHLIMLMIYIPIFKMFTIFKRNPSKKDTFITAVKSFVLLSLSMIITLALAIILK